MHERPTQKGVHILYVHKTDKRALVASIRARCLNALCECRGTDWHLTSPGLGACERVSPEGFFIWMHGLTDWARDSPVDLDAGAAERQDSAGGGAGFGLGAGDAAGRGGEDSRHGMGPNAQCIPRCLLCLACPWPPFHGRNSPTLYFSRLWSTCSSHHLPASVLNACLFILVPAVDGHPTQKHTSHTHIRARLTLSA